MLAMKSLFAAVTSIALFGVVPFAQAAQPGLDIQVYNPGEKGIFAVSSEIIAGEKEVVLIDAQFSIADANKLVDKIKATGKKLTTVYISHSDPDYYFGLEAIKKAFPDVRVLATPETVAAIRASKDGKLAFWGPILKENAPKQVFTPDVLQGNTLTVDGNKLEVMGLKGATPDRSYVWIPSIKAVVGGVVVMANQHVWIADTQTEKSRQNWLQTLADIEALKPTMVVPGHYMLNKDGSQPFTIKSVQFTRDYLKAFDKEAKESKNSAELIAAMKKLYPGLAGDNLLDMSAKVIKGEMQWPAAEAKPAYPAAGKKMAVSFGETTFELNFHDDKSMSYIGTAGMFKGMGDDVQYTAVPIRPQVFMVYWHEPKTGSNVVHVQDFENGIVYTNIAQTDGQFLHMQGKLAVQNG
jgi:glyoxylase-like metal-dependent hydrolase (beta-lactamase superfamily II)